jgi:hypothetical protein
VKIILLDACETGPEINFKSPLTGASDTFLAEYIKRTSGAVVLASCTAGQTSSAKSPVALSLFTHFLVKALRGDVEALRTDRLLTLDSLYEYLSKNVESKSREYGRLQCPSRRFSDNGSVLLGDFSRLPQRIDLDLESFPIESISLQVRRFGTAQETLGGTFKVRSSDRPTYVEGRVNQQLAQDRRQELGRLRVELCDEFGFTFSQVQVGDCGLSFPGGVFEFRYRSDKEDTHSGTYVEWVDFEPEWFGELDRMAELAETLGVSADQMILHLNQTIDPESWLAGLKVRGWKITSALDEEVKAEQNGVTLVVKTEKLILRGFSPAELLASGKDQTHPKAHVLPGIAGLLGRGRS